MKTATAATAHKLSATESLDAYLVKLRGQMKLEGWDQFVENVKVPAALASALIAGRPELAKIMPATDLPAAEVKNLYHLIAVLIETNHALQMHAQETAKLVDQWHQAFTALDRAGDKIKAFANFQTSDEADAEEDHAG